MDYLNSYEQSLAKICILRCYFDLRDDNPHKSELREIMHKIEENLKLIKKRGNI